MMEDQVIYNFLFKITPLEIRQNQRLIRANNKSIVIKLGNKEVKCKQLNTTVELLIPVLYSKTLNQYCPIKGITKIYDVNTDGSEMICCVGAFQTEDLLNEGTTETTINREIGPFKLKMKINYKKIDESALGSKKSLNKNEDQQKEEVTPYIMDDSSHELQKLDEFSVDGFSQLSEEMKKSERQVMGQQLVEERRNNKLLEDKLEKSRLKMQLLKKKNIQFEEEIKENYSHFIKFISWLQTDTKGNFLVEINERKKQIHLQCASAVKKSDIQECFSFMRAKSKYLQESSRESTVQLSYLIQRMDLLEEQKTSLAQENERMQKQISELKSKSQAYSSFQTFKKQPENGRLQIKLRKLMEENKSLEGMNQYLREKDAQMEGIITTKESTIQNLRQMMNDTNVQLQNQEKIINNFQLTIEELKEEISDQSETIESYREKYGDLKAAKDKALQREIKDCLRWIDSQNREEEELNLEDTMEPSVTSYIKSSMQEIEHMPVEEMSVIRNEIMGILKKVDQLIAKNSI